MNKTVLFLLLAGFAGATLAGAVEKVGSLYKWTDENGQVHYSDTPPPEIAKQERQVLNDRGVVVETLAAQKTEEQLAAEQKQRELEEQQRKAAEEQAARDKVLLSTYATVADIERTRDNRIAAIDAQIRVASGTVASLEEQVIDLETRAKAFTDQNKPVPAPIQRDLDKARKLLLDNQKFMVKRKQEQEEVRAHYDTEIAHFKEVKGISDTTKTDVPASPSPTP